MPIFSRLNLGDVSLRHHWSREPLRLHSYHHKGYWFLGKRRERANMERFAELISPGDTVIDVGAHIGYVSMYFAHLVGKSGQVYAFEPGENNLAYARANLEPLAQVTLLEMGVGAVNATLPLYTDDLSGQNNSFLSDFVALSGTADEQGVEIHVQQQDVEVVSLDAFASAG